MVGLEQLLAEGAAELLDVRRQRHAVDLEQHLAGQRVAVGVQAGRAHGDHDVAGADPVGPEHLVGLDHTDAGRGQVVVAVRHHAGVLRRLATEQRATGLDAAFGDAADEFGDTLRDDSPDGDVVLQEQRLGTADDEVVDDHRDQVEADGVVLVECLSDGELGAHTVRGRREQRLLVVTLEREQTRESAETTENLGTAGPLGQGSEEFHRPIACGDVHSCGGVGRARATCRILGHVVVTPAFCCSSKSCRSGNRVL